MKTKNECRSCRRIFAFAKSDDVGEVGYCNAQKQSCTARRYYFGCEIRLHLSLAILSFKGTL